MLALMRTGPTSPRDRTAREDRARRILEAAAELLIRWGYNRVTIEDIARHAEIGKGTIYLHWKTREQLFTTLLEREVLAAVQEVIAELRCDSQTALLHRFTRSYFLAIMRRPILRAFFRADAETLGKLSRPAQGTREDRHRVLLHGYLDLLAQQGLLRADLPTEALGTAFLATLQGFIVSEPSSDARQAMSLEARSELLAQTVRSAFESAAAFATDEVALRTIDLLSSLENSPEPDARPTQRMNDACPQRSNAMPCTATPTGCSSRSQAAASAHTRSSSTLADAPVASMPIPSALIP
ncbi:helix-turn-helix domain-containing protein [Frankia sp. Cas3]|uniref:TetR/AcrR family transcriptional regulator n=1 Tax=Frankia sp. Cas3 TaxID=3073926 RepID=UPI002AD3A173|nr:helix-turn-helix domain-containing protein [Frankia sp. Cas3]